MEVLQWKAIAGTKFQTCDLPIQIFFDLQPYNPNKNRPFSWLLTIWPHSSVQYFGGPCFRSFAVKTYPDAHITLD